MKENQFIYQLINSITELKNHKWKLLFIPIYIFICLTIYKSRIYIFSFDSNLAFFVLYEKIMDIAFVLFSLVCFIYLIIFLGKPPHKEKYKKRMMRAGFVNHLGEPPEYITAIRDKKKRQLITLLFNSNGIILSKWEDNQETIEQCLNKQVLKMEYSKDTFHVKVFATPFNALSKIKFVWNDNLLSHEDFVLILGENFLHSVTINLNESPHLLIGGSTGSGKTILLKNLLMQCVKKNARVFIIDLKGAVDFSSNWTEKCFLLYHPNEVLAILEYLVEELENRKRLFRESECPDIIKYNQKTNSNLQRIILACDEFGELLDKTGLSKEKKELVQAIEGHFSTLARQGRAFGLHLFLSTQRPSADVLSGHIKSNIDFRICGKADHILSQIILDNTSASTRIPKHSQGEFLIHSGEIFRGYWMDDKDIF